MTFRWVEPRRSASGSPSPELRLLEGDRTLAAMAVAGGDALRSCTQLVALAEPTLVHPAQPARPNLLVDLVDTLRADHCTPFRGDRDTTPQLARVAAEGIAFERACSQAPWTRPSVATLFTSRLSSFHGAGHATAAVVANAHDCGDSLNFEQGFSRFAAVEIGKKRGTARADSIHRVAIDWLRKNADRPFFLYAHPIDPHAPYDPLLSRLGIAAPPASFMGVDLAACRRGEPAPELDVIAEEEAGVMASLLADRFKLIRSRGAGAAEWTKLFDLGADPREQHDLAALQPEIAQRLWQRLEAQWGDYETSGFVRVDAAPQRLDAATKAALRALGYVDDGDDRQARMLTPASSSPAAAPARRRLPGRRA